MGSSVYISQSVWEDGLPFLCYHENILRSLPPFLKQKEKIQIFSKSFETPLRSTKDLLKILESLRKPMLAIPNFRNARWSS